MIEEVFSNIHTTLPCASQDEQQILIARRVCNFLILFSILCEAKLAASALLFQYPESMHIAFFDNYCA